MATSNKRPLGFGIFGFAFAMTGLIFLFTGQGVLGTTLAVAGLLLFILAVVATRKPAESGSTAPTQPVRVRS